jgi:hypothetical protein
MASAITMPCAAWAADPPLNPSKDARSFLLFAALEHGPHKHFDALGFKYAPGIDSLDRNGWRVLGRLGMGYESPRRKPARGWSASVEAQLLAGREWHLGRTSIGLYVGPEVIGSLQSNPDAAVYKLRGSGRVLLDLWSQPTDHTLVQAYLGYSTYQQRLGGRLALGWQLQERLFIGPEIELYRDSDYRKVRFGAHLTGLRFAAGEWRISGGWQRDTAKTKGAYATLGVHWKR